MRAADRVRAGERYKVVGRQPFAREVSLELVEVGGGRDEVSEDFGSKGDSAVATA